MRKKYVGHPQSGFGCICIPHEETFVDSNGIRRCRIVYRDVSAIEQRIPSPKDYTLENLLKAGVKLDEVPVSGLLSSGEKLEHAAINRIYSTLGALLKKEGSVVAESEVSDGSGPDIKAGS